MEFKTFGDYSFELRLIRRMIGERRTEDIQQTYNRLLRGTKISGGHFTSFGSLTAFSKENSYQILACYSLLDVVDRFFDGYRFTNIEDTGDYFLFRELKVGESGDICDLEDIQEHLQKIARVIKVDVHIFLLPYKNEIPYSIINAAQSKIVILNSDTTENVIEALFHALAEIHHKQVSFTRLPRWASNGEEFKKEFVEWCRGNKSKFS